MRCVLNGTQYTQDSLYYAGKVVSSNCKFCGSDQHKDVVDQTDAPTATTCHVWIPKATHLGSFRSGLLALPDTTAHFFPLPLLQPDVRHADLFIDGSCLRPHDPSTRLASWGVVLWDGCNFGSLACGGVPGWRQTSLRAEITAAISALKFLAVCVEESINDHRYLALPCYPYPNSPNLD